MKALAMTLGLIVSASTSLAAGMNYQCEGSILTYQTRVAEKVRLAMSTDSMSIEIQKEDGAIAKYDITSSERLKSYMKGTQFIDAKRVSGEGVDEVRVRMPWTSYYGASAVDLALMDGPNSMAGGALICDNPLYQGPTQFKR